MKKVSTAAAKQSRNISQPALTIGLDLGYRNSWYCVLDESGQIQLEQRVRTHAKAQREIFGGIPRSRIARTGTHSPCYPDVLRNAVPCWSASIRLRSETNESTAAGSTAAMSNTDWAGIVPRCSDSILTSIEAWPAESTQ